MPAGAGAAALLVAQRQVALALLPCLDEQAMLPNRAAHLRRLLQETAQALDPFTGFVATWLLVAVLWLASVAVAGELPAA